MNLVSGLVRLYAALLLALGAALLFVPELASPAGSGAGPPALVLAQLVGAALLGFAGANWTARGAVLGGIYGRAVVVGNQAFAFIGLLVLLKGAPSERGLPFWALLLVLAFGAALYSVLLYRPSWLTGPAPGPPAA